MNFYKQKQKWKYVLFLVAIIISALSIYLIDDLDKELEKSINSLSQSIETLKQNEVTLKNEESSNIKNFAKAYQTLNNMTLDDEGDYSWAIDLIQQNKTIPVIRVDDECYDILDWKNIEIPKDIDEDYKIAFVKALKTGVKILCYDCKLNSEEIKLNKQINYDK